MVSNPQMACRTFGESRLPNMKRIAKITTISNEFFMMNSNMIDVFKSQGVSRVFG
ncbi:MAG: hypothetical protein ACRC2T_00160 [Thermoguttaceae bacterium]